MTRPRSFNAPTVTLLLGFAAMVFGVWGQFTRLPPGALAPGWFEAVLDAARLFTLDPKEPEPRCWQFLLARSAALGAVAIGVLGIVTHVLPEWSLRLRLQLLDLRLRLRGAPRHVVVCGLGRIGIQLVRDFRTGPDRPTVVVIERDSDNLRLPSARRLGAIVIVGDAHELATLHEARVADAREVFIVCGDDSTNLDLVGDVEREIAQRHVARGLRCYLNILSPQLTEVCRSRDVFRGRTNTMQVEIFNVLENSARLLLTKELGVDYAPKRDHVAYYVVLGFGAMGRTFAREAAKLAHFANCKRLRMSVVDDFAGTPEIAMARDRFLAVHPGFCPKLGFDLEQFARGGPRRDEWDDKNAHPASAKWQTQRINSNAIEYAVNAEFLELGPDAGADDLLSRLRARLQLPGVSPCIVVCFDDDRRNFEVACQLRERLGAYPIFVYLPADHGLVELLQAGHTAGMDHGLHGVRAFGACEESANAREVRGPETGTIAATFHEAYQAIVDPEKKEAASQLWEKLDYSFRRSNKDAADHIDIKLRAVDCKRDATLPEGAERVIELKPHEVDVLMEVEHNRYLGERLTAGWRYGPRDDVERTREALVPWSALVKTDVEKDRAQILAILPALVKCKQVVFRI